MTHGQKRNESSDRLNVYKTKVCLEPLIDQGLEAVHHLKSILSSTDWKDLRKCLHVDTSTNTQRPSGIIRKTAVCKRIRLCH